MAYNTVHLPLALPRLADGTTGIRRDVFMPPVASLHIRLWVTFAGVDLRLSWVLYRQRHFPRTIIL